MENDAIIVTLFTWLLATASVVAAYASVCKATCMVNASTQIDDVDAHWC